MTFSWYGLLVGLGFSVCLSFVEREVPKKYERFFPWLIAVIAVFSLIGARVYHVVTDWSLYTSASLWDLLAVWNGGLGIFGGILGGSLGLVLWKKWCAPELSLRHLSDAFALGLPWGQAIGRWGNFINQELFGKPTQLPWGIHIDSALLPPELSEATRFHPLFLYESFLCVCLGSALFVVSKKKPRQLGQLTGLYLLGYSSIRFSLEFLRFASAAGPFSLTIAQWVCVVGFLLGIFLLVSGRKRSLQ